MLRFEEYLAAREAELQEGPLGRKIGAGLGWGVGAGLGAASAGFLAPYLAGTMHMPTNAGAIGAAAAAGATQFSKPGAYLGDKAGDWLAKKFGKGQQPQNMNKKMKKK